MISFLGLQMFPTATYSQNSTIHTLYKLCCSSNAFFLLPFRSHDTPEKIIEGWKISVVRSKQQVFCALQWLCIKICRCAQLVCILWVMVICNSKIPHTKKEVNALDETCFSMVIVNPDILSGLKNWYIAWLNILEFLLAVFHKLTGQYLFQDTTQEMFLIMKCWVSTNNKKALRQ